MSRKLITVTAEHIRKGKRTIDLHPIARALRAAGFTGACMGDTLMLVPGGIVKAPRSVMAFNRKFANRWAVKPFSFYLNY